MGKLKTLLLDVINDRVMEMEIEDDLDTFYKYLNCRCITIINVEIGGRRFDVMCDDEGLLKDRPIISAINKEADIVLVGNLLFFNSSSGGDLTSLTPEDTNIIASSIKVVLDGNVSVMRHCLTDVRW